MPITIVAFLWQLFERELRDLAFLEECMNFSLSLYDIVPNMFEKMPCELVNLIGQKLAENHDDKDIWYHFYRKYNNASKRRKRQIDNHKYNLRSLSKKRRKL